MAYTRYSMLSRVKSQGLLAKSYHRLITRYTRHSAKTLVSLKGTVCLRTRFAVSDMTVGLMARENRAILIGHVPLSLPADDPQQPLYLSFVVSEI